MLPLQSSPRMRNKAENLFEAGRHADGKREDHRHGILCSLNDEVLSSICSSIIFASGN
jgi:hypothetical protein